MKEFRDDVPDIGLLLWLLYIREVRLGLYDVQTRTENRLLITYLTIIHTNSVIYDRPLIKIINNTTDIRLKNYVQRL